MSWIMHPDVLYIKATNVDFLQGVRFKLLVLCGQFTG